MQDPLQERTDVTSKHLPAASLVTLALATPLRTVTDTPTREGSTSEQSTREVPNGELPTKEDPDMTVERKHGRIQ